LKIALISDIHGNLEALQAALASIDRRAPQKIICLGDVVGYGANPLECLEIVRSRADLHILGNHDAAGAGRDDLTYFNEFARAALVWTQTVLSAAQKDYLSSRPLVEHVGDLHLVHATPKNPEAWNYVFSAGDMAEQFPEVKGSVCFVGHSHIPGEYWERKAEAGAADSSRKLNRRIVNVGSVGQPRDRNSKLCYVIYDDESGQVEFIREEYDVETAAGKIRRTGLPEFLADRLLWGW
jgi:diadenosine tetraphosphatase ApaH/serine/threonine PP2A family protein phosphatase